MFKTNYVLLPQSSFTYWPYASTSASHPPPLFTHYYCCQHKYLPFWLTYSLDAIGFICSVFFIKWFLVKAIYAAVVKSPHKVLIIYKNKAMQTIHSWTNDVATKSMNNSSYKPHNGRGTGKAHGFAKLDKFMCQPAAAYWCFQYTVSAQPLLITRSEPIYSYHRESVPQLSQKILGIYYVFMHVLIV